ncbi:hypothetical protein LXL04_027760 [Taraxacum kok-saghyz]
MWKMNQKDGAKTNPVTQTAPIHMEADGLMSLWLNTRTVHGELKSIDHLGHLPQLLEVKVDELAGIKYIGGMRALLSFVDQEAAMKFLEEKRKWGEAFNWLKFGEPIDTKFESVAWVKILGLPLKLWNENNCKAIIKEFGKLLIPFGEIRNRTDLSCITLGITTDSVKRINEAVLVETEGRQIKIGVVEFEKDGWFPFRFEIEEQPFKSEPEKQEKTMEEKMEDSENGNLSGIPDNWNNDVEEGEITGEEEEVNKEKVVGNIPDNTPAQGKNTGGKVGGKRPLSPTAMSWNEEMDSQTVHGRVKEPAAMTMHGHAHPALNDAGQQSTPNGGPPSNGPYSIPLDWFGPFPSMDLRFNPSLNSAPLDSGKGPTRTPLKRRRVITQYRSPAAANPAPIQTVIGDLSNTPVPP